MKRELLVKSREFDYSNIEISEQEQRAYFKGYVLKYEEFDKHGDKFQHGSLSKTLNDWTASNSRILPIRSYEHAKPIGGILEWEDRPEGWYLTKAFLNLKTEGGREHLSLIEDKVIHGMSMQGPLYRASGKRPYRTIVEAGLRHVAVTDDPAQTGSSIELVKTLLSNQIPPEKITEFHRVFDSFLSPETPSDDTSRADEELKKTALILTDINKTLTQWRSA